MDHIELQRRFLHDVITPLCSKYQKDPHEGASYFQAAYYKHRAQYGSFAHVENRGERLNERYSFMMLHFFQWLYKDMPPLDEADRVDAQSTQ